MRNSIPGGNGRSRSAAVGKCRQFFIMRQNDRADLEDMVMDIMLSEITQHAIMNYRRPTFRLVWARVAIGIAR